MRAQQKRGGRRLPLAGKLGNQIYELDRAPRGVVTECLTRYLPARATKLVLNVISGFFDSRRSSWAGPEINEPLNMTKSFLAGEFLPDLRGLCLCQ
jgi:hypothetical protein